MAESVLLNIDRSLAHLNMLVILVANIFPEKLQLQKHAFMALFHVQTRSESTSLNISQ